MRRGGAKAFSQTIYSNRPLGNEELPERVHTILGRPSPGNRQLLQDISAFTRKRFIAKEEVWPKMRVAQGVPSLQFLAALQPYLASSRLMDERQLEAAQTKETASVHLVHSLLFEPGLPEMLREYTMKIPVCGLEPALNDLPAFAPLHRSLNDLFRAFYRAKLTATDVQALKQFVLLYRESVLESLKMSDFTLVEEESARVARDIKNCRVRDLEYFDDFLPIPLVG